MGLRFLTNLFKIKLLDYYMFLSWGFNGVFFLFFVFNSVVKWANPKQEK